MAWLLTMVASRFVIVHILQINKNKEGGRKRERLKKDACNIQKIMMEIGSMKFDVESTPPYRV